MHDERVLDAEPTERRRHALGDARVSNTEHLRARPGRVGERTEDVKDGANADLAAERRRKLHRRMVGRREHETEAGLLQTLRHRRRRQFDRRAERVEHVGAAALPGHTAVAVLGDGLTGPGDHKSRRR